MRLIRRWTFLLIVLAIPCLVFSRAHIPCLRPDGKSLMLELINPNEGTEGCIFKLWLYNDYNAVFEYVTRDGVYRHSFISNAAYGRRHEVVEWLLNKGADPNPSGQSPLHEAIVREDWELAAKLVKAGTKWTALLDSGETVRGWAVKKYPQGMDEIERRVNASGQN